MNTHFTVRTTYDELQSSTKIISQGKLTSDGGIFFTGTQQWYRGAAALSVLSNSQHTKHHKLQYKNKFQQ